MRIEPVSADNLEDFRAYCRAHRYEHDESYLDDEDLRLENLTPPGNPSFLLRDIRLETAGVVSLMLARYAPSGQGRFRILHALSGEGGNYRALLEALLPQTGPLKGLFLFLPEGAAAGKLLLELGFAIQRYSWLLTRSAEGAQAPVFAEGYKVSPLRPGEDEAAWCEIVNLAFADLAGHTDLQPPEIAGWRSRADYLDGGMLMLRHRGLPVGVVQMVRDEAAEDAAGLEGLAIHPAWQGRGLGRGLLRAGIQFAREAGFARVGLSVHAESESALGLYLAEGFAKQAVMVCYGLSLENG